MMIKMKKKDSLFELYLAGAFLSFGLSIFISLILNLVTIQTSIVRIIAPYILGSAISGYLIAGKTPQKVLSQGISLGLFSFTIHAIAMMLFKLFTKFGSLIGGLWTLFGFIIGSYIGFILKMIARKHINIDKV